MEQKSQIRFGKVIEEDTPLYRYMTFSQFVSFVETKQTYLTKISMWNDPWEAALDKVMVKYGDGDLRQRNYSLSEDTYGQCWTLKEESEAMWNIYSPNLDGVKIKTTAKKLNMISGISQGYLDRVEYTDYSNLPLEVINESPFGTMLLKRKAFSHEEEVRLLTNAQAYGEFRKTDSHMNFELEPKGFIEEIVIDPRAKEWLVNAIIKYCCRSGIGVVPMKSKLLDDFDPRSSLNLYLEYVPVEEGD